MYQHLEGKIAPAEPVTSTFEPMERSKHPVATFFHVFWKVCYCFFES